MRLAIVTPSYIHSQQRAQFARRSLASLREVVGETYPHIVVDDLPRPGSAWHGAGKEVYDKSNIIYVQRPKRLGGVTALLRAVRVARDRDFDLCFIHLDDNVYVPELRQLLRHACDAFERDIELAQIRLVGYPLINKNCTAELGNRTQIEIIADEVSFSGVCLTSSRQSGYTLWWARFWDGVVESRCWPIVLWLSVYRAEFLEEVLAQAVGHRYTTLGQVEEYYRNKGNWSEQQFSRKLGFVNMQFGGFEIHRNKNWQEIISVPNMPVR